MKERITRPGDWGWPGPVCEDTKPAPNDPNFHPWEIVLVLYYGLVNKRIRQFNIKKFSDAVLGLQKYLKEIQLDFLMKEFHYLPESNFPGSYFCEEFYDAYETLERNGHTETPIVDDGEFNYSIPGDIVKIKIYKDEVREDIKNFLAQHKDRNISEETIYMIIDKFIEFYKSSKK